METSDERLAALYARAAAGPKRTILTLAVTSPDALHHWIGVPRGTFGRLMRGPDREQPDGALYLTVAESPHVDLVDVVEVLAYLLRRPIHSSSQTSTGSCWVEPDIAHHAHEGPRRVRLDIGDRGHDLHLNIEDLADGITRGAALLRRPFREHGADTSPAPRPGPGRGRLARALPPRRIRG